MGTGSVGLVIPEQFDEVPTRGELLNSEAGPSSKQAGKQATDEQLTEALQSSKKRVGRVIGNGDFTEIVIEKVQDK